MIPSPALLAFVAACGAALAPTGFCPLPPQQPAVRPVALAAGELLHVRVEAHRVDLALELARPDGTRLRRANERFSGDGVEELFWIADGAELATFAVRPLAGGGGAYRILEVERRAATAADRRRVEAITAGLEMRELYAAATEAASRELAARGPAVAERLAAEGFPERSLAVLHQRARGIREDLGDHAGARAAFIDLAAQAAALDLPARRADALTFLAIEERQRGELRAAEPLLVEALAEARRSGDRQVLADVLGVHAGLLDLLGRPRESLAAQRESIALQGELGRVESVALARTNLGSALYRLGALDAAAEEFATAEQVLRRLGKTGQLALVLSNLGAVWLARGEPELAVEVLEEAVRYPVSTGTSDYRIRALLTLGNAYQDLGRRAEAVACAREAEGLARETDFPHLVGLALEDRAEYAAEAGDLTAAAVRFAESVEILRRAGDPERLAAVLARSADTARRRRELERAAAEASEARRLATAGGFPLRELDASVALARLARDQGELPRAREEVRQALEVVERVRAGLGAGSDRRSFLARMREVYELEVAIELELDRKEPAAGHPAAAFAAAERGRARWLLDLLDPAAGPRPSSSAAELVDSSARLRGAQGRLLARRQAPAGDGEQKRLEQELDAAARDLAAARAALDRARPNASGFGRAATTITAETVARALAPGEVLLEYVLGEEVAVLFVVRREGITAHRLAPAPEIERAVDALLAEMERASALGAAAFRERAVAVHRLLLAAAAGELVGVTRLLVVPDGPLHRLPFALLVDGGEGGATFGELAYLAKRFELVRLPSAAVWRALAERSAASSLSAARAGSVAGSAFGDPRIAQVEGRGSSTAATRRALLDFEPGALGALPGSRAEAAEVARWIPGVRLFVGAEASEARVKRDREVAASRLLHFAVHGLASDRRPELSTLLLAAEGTEDGLLQAWEIEELALSSDLVVLSSCRSALGREVAGEGMVGLTQAFLDAGARGVLAALSPVDDGATARLMGAFYLRLGRGEAPAAALAGARRELLAAGGLDAHPARWAPFVLFGDPPALAVR